MTNENKRRKKKNKQINEDYMNEKKMKEKI